MSNILHSTHSKALSLFKAYRGLYEHFPSVPFENWGRQGEELPYPASLCCSPEGKCSSSDRNMHATLTFCVCMYVLCAFNFPLLFSFLLLL